MSQTAPVDLIVNKKAVPKEFNRIAARYDFATSMSQGYSIDLEASVQKLNLKGDEHVLDLCCGTGKSTLPLLKALPHGRITGLDNSEGMLEEARKKFKTEIECGKMDFVLRDAMNPEMEPESFDVVFAAYGLRNMPDYQTFLNNAFSLLKPGGKICIHDYSLADNAWSKPYWAVLGYGFIVPFCTAVTGSSKIFTYLVKSVLDFPGPKEIETLLSRAGFTQIQSHPHAGWRAPILHAIVAQKDN